MKSMTQPSLVLFDCDGVLVDSERISHTVLRDLLGEHGVDLTLEQTFDHFMGSSTAKGLETVAALMGRPVPSSFDDTFNARCQDAFTQSLSPVAGVHELLARLPLRYCVASNGPRKKMRFTLGHTGLLSFLEGRLFSADDVERPKPAPDLFLHAAATLGVAAADCVVVEDSVSGVLAARAAGMRALGFAAMGQGEKLRQAGAHVVFGEMASLPSLLNLHGT